MTSAPAGLSGATHEGPRLSSPGSTSVALLSAGAITVVAVVSLGVLVLPRLGGGPAGTEGVLYAVVSTAVAIAVAWQLAVRPLHAAIRRQSDDLHRVLEATPDAVLAVDSQQRMTFVNEQTRTLFDYLPGELESQPIDTIVRGDLSTTAHQSLNGHRKDGRDFPIDVTWHTVASDPEPWSLVFIRDVTREAAVALELQQAKTAIESELGERRRLQGLTGFLRTMQSLDGAGPVLSLHLENLLLGTNGAVYLFNRRREGLESVAAWGWGPLLEERFAVDDCWALRLGAIHDANGSDRKEPCPHATGAVGGYWCVPIIADGETLGILHVRQDETPPGAAPISGDLAEQTQRLAVAAADRLALPLATLRLREALRNESIRDPLTRVFNRRYMEESLAREISSAARRNNNVSLVMLDLDHFKQVNDTHGHVVGDDILRAFGQFLTKSLRGDDVVCRYGGEEFALILPEAPSLGAVSRLNELREAWRKIGLDRRDGGLVFTTFSGGVATFPMDGSDSAGLVKSADRALYKAKALGRNQVLGANVVLASDPAV